MQSDRDTGGALVTMSRCAPIVLLIGCALALPARAQVEEPATIVSEGQGDATVPPAVLEFVLECVSTGDTFAAAAEPLANFEERLRAALEGADMKPLELTLGGLRLTTDEEGARAAHLAAILRFDTAPLLNAETPAAEFATWADNIHALAATLGQCTLTGPIFKAADPQAVEQNAISRATENALYRADAVATLMESRIYAVQRVHIREVTWTSAETAPSPVQAPSLDNITCHARVDVEYLYAPY